MHSLQYRIDPAVFVAHPGYRRGVVVIRDAVNTRGGAAIEALLRPEEERLRVRLRSASVTDQPGIAACRDAYRRFGAKPSEHGSSIEALARCPSDLWVCAWLV
jgi:DNA/RNA-binding domain of Phe-tRNA-synthetase-like protein